MYPFARVKYQLSVALRNAGKNEAAVGEINAYLKLRPLSKDGLTQAAILSAEAGRLDEALEYTGRLLDRYPAETDMLNNRAKILFVKGDTQGAVALYNKILAMEPDNKVAKDNLNAILYMVKSSNRNSRFEHSK
jgi:tetratricopeptide (TPR) repeat protein